MKMKTKVLLAGAALAGALAAAPAAAKPADFSGCDGFRAPGRNGDGMHRRALRYSWAQPGTRSGLPVPPTPERAAAGIEACETSLAAPELLPAHVLRRASLLRSRGAFRLHRGDTADALADFALSDEAAAAAPDPYYGRSLGLGTAMMRAYAHHVAGRRDEAIAAAEAARALRPTNPDLGVAAARITLAATGDLDRYAADMRSVARYNPNLIVPLYALAAVRGRFDEVLALQPHIILTVPANRGGYVIADRDNIIARNFILRIEIDGTHAFALAALGRQGEAEAEIRRIGADVDAALTRPTLPPGETDERVIRRQMNRWTILSERGKDARERFAFYQNLVRWRVMAADGRAAQAAAEVLRAPPGADGLALNLYEALAVADPESRAQLDPIVAETRRRIAAQLTQLAALNSAEIVDRLPEGEFASRVPGYNGGSDDIILGLGGDGFMSRRSSIPGARTVKFASDEGTPSTNSEMALLRAAELARARNMRGLILLDRRVTERMSQTTSYGRIVDTDHQGFEAELDVLFVDPAALPAGFETAGWRVLDAEDIYSQLAPVYIRRPAAPTRARGDRT
jgi:tetratricopeptide (TPR) repeat protein